MKHIGTQLEYLYTYFQGLPFPVYSGKPATIPSSRYAYFELVSNSGRIESNYLGKSKISKIGRFEIVFYGDMNTPAQELFEMQHAFTDSKCVDTSIVIGNITALSLQEGEMSGILYDSNKCPYSVMGLNVHYLC